MKDATTVSKSETFNSQCVTFETNAAYDMVKNKTVMNNIIILALAKLGFDKLRMSSKATKAKSVVKALTGNPNFSNPVPPLAEVQTAINEFEDSLRGLDGSRLKTEIKNNKEKALDEKISSLQGYVQAASGGDPAKILSSGFELRAPNKRVGILDKIEELTLTPTLIPGQIIFKWKSVKQAKMYAVEYRYTSTGDWQRTGETTKAKITIQNLTSGAYVEVRVACLTSAGRGPWTDSISCKVY